MDSRTDIELDFSDPQGALAARRIAEAMICAYFQNGYEYLPFDGMEKEYADGWAHYPERYVPYESVGALKNLWTDYRRACAACRRAGDYPHREEAEALAARLRMDRKRLKLEDCDGIRQDYQIEHHYFEDFFSMLCLMLAAALPDAAFEGMRRTAEPGSYAKRILTRAAYDGETLTFEQMEGDPVYNAVAVSWTRAGDRLRKAVRAFPSILVNIVTDDRDAVERDGEIRAWIRNVNHVRTEMAAARLRVTHPSFNPYPHVMLYGATRAICEKHRDALLALLKEKGYAANLFSILLPGECAGTQIAIPASVTKIGDKAFRQSARLQSVEIPGGVTEIGDEAFQQCGALEEIALPDGIAAIGSFAFAACGKLRAVRLPQGLQKLSAGAFSGCVRLENVVLPERVTDIGDYAFSRCESLKSIVIPPRVRQIGKEAFKDCTGLESVLILSDPIRISPSAFQGCRPLLRGKKGGDAERWAAENGYPFEEA